MSGFIFPWGWDAPLKQFPGNGCRSNASCRKLENELYHHSSFRVWLHSAIGAFAIPIRANLTLIFSTLHFGVFGTFGFHGHIAAVILADQIFESHIHPAGITFVLIAVEIVIDGDKPGVKQWEHPLDEVAVSMLFRPNREKSFTMMQSI